MDHRPILLNSCARAATAAEAKFRIDAPIAPSRGTRIVALDRDAADIVRRVAAREWANARFYTYDGEDLSGGFGDEGTPDLVIHTVAGDVTRLADELVDSGVAVMVASSDAGSAAASLIGAACTVRGIMTAGLVLSDSERVGEALSALRPHARVLMVPADEDDLSELLAALRA